MILIKDNSFPGFQHENVSGSLMLKNVFATMWSEWLMVNSSKQKPILLLHLFRYSTAPLIIYQMVCLTVFVE